MERERCALERHWAAPASPDLKPKIKVAFASGTDELNRRLIEQMRAIFPELPLYVVSDFPPEDQDLIWIRYRINRGFMENLWRCREALRDRSVQLAAVMLVPGVPFRRMRLMALLLSPRGFLAFNENLNHFMLRPRSVPAIARHLAWRARNALRSMAHSARSAAISAAAILDAVWPKPVITRGQWPGHPRMEAAGFRHQRECFDPIETHYGGRY